MPYGYTRSKTAYKPSEYGTKEKILAGKRRCRRYVYGKYVFDYPCAYGIYDNRIDGIDRECESFLLISVKKERDINYYEKERQRQIRRRQLG